MIYGLTVFLIENKAVELVITDKIINLLTQQGFYLLCQKILSRSEIDHLKSYHYLSKSSWLKGIDDPAIVAVAFDLLPIPLNPPQKSKYPNIDNARVLTKQKINDYCHDYQPHLKKSNLLHSTNNSEEAWEFLQTIMVKELENLHQQIDQLCQSFATNFPIKRNLSSYYGYRRRSKLELIEYQGNLAVKKTFRPGCERFFKRELFVIQELSKMRVEIPSLIASGSSFLIFPYYEDTLNFTPNCEQIPLLIAKQAMEVLRFFYDLGYALIDFYPGNLIIDRQEGLKVIDFEFLYRYQTKPKSFLKCYDLVGIPANFDGDKPLGSLYTGSMYWLRTYERDWKPYTKVELNTLLE